MTHCVESNHSGDDGGYFERKVGSEGWEWLSDEGTIEVNGVAEFDLKDLPEGVESFEELGVDSEWEWADRMRSSFCGASGDDISLIDLEKYVKGAATEDLADCVFRAFELNSSDVPKSHWSSTYDAELSETLADCQKRMRDEVKGACKDLKAWDDVAEAQVSYSDQGYGDGMDPNELFDLIPDGATVIIHGRDGLSTKEFHSNARAEFYDWFWSVCTPAVAQRYVAGEGITYHLYDSGFSSSLQL